MNGTEWNDLLDLALARLKAESLADILADYPAQAGELRPLLLAATSLQTLRPVTLPPTEAQAAGRAAFLAQVEQLPRLAVSPSPVVRLKEWVTNRLTQFSGQIWPPKETKRMNTLLLRVTLMIVLLLGTAGGTAVLSADSLPDSFLYPVKLAVEDTRLGLATDPAAEAALNLALAETRLQEIVAMSQAGKVLDEVVINRLENHFDAALQLAAQMPDEAMIGFLVQTRDRIRTQENDLAQAQEHVSGAGEASLEQANGLLNRLRLQIENGLQEPQLFRRQHGHMPEGAPREAGPCNDGNCEPAGNANQYGQDPANEGHNGASYGDGNCGDAADCVPAGNANQYGQDPTNDGHNGPSYGDGNCDNSADCVPAGNANQYGQDPTNDGHNG
ncbi:MAG: hypothetical protein KJ069_09590, partial [Anaerolineae bacterium]|nr:hypothetical protein [Anaerolineae bacterium]